MAKFMPPQGFIYDRGSGYYYCIRTVRDNAGKPMQVVTWFNPNTGEFLDKPYVAPPQNAPAGNIPPNNAAAGNVPPQSAPTGNMPLNNAPMGNVPSGNIPRNNIPPKNAMPSNQKKGGMPVWAWILIIIGVAVAVFAACFFLLRRNPESADPAQTSSSSSSAASSAQTSGNSVSEERLLEPLVTDIKGKSPMLANPVDYRVTLNVSNKTSLNIMRITGMGDMTGKFQVNPANFINDDGRVYCWDFMFTDDLGVRVYGEYLNFGPEAAYWEATPYIKAQIIHREEGALKEVYNVVVYPEEDGVRLSHVGLRDYDANLNCFEITSMRVNTKLVNYRQSNMVPVSVKDRNGNDISSSNSGQSMPAEEVKPAEEAKSEDENKAANINPAGEEKPSGSDSVEQSGSNLHYSGMSGFPYADTYICTDESLGEFRPMLSLDSDGHCELYANMGDGMYLMQGYYEYSADQSEYSDQGAVHHIYMHFPGNSGNLSYAEATYDGEVDGGYIYFHTPGFGLMGGNEYDAGYFTRL